MVKRITYSLLATALCISASANAQEAAAEPALTFNVERSAVDSQLAFSISAEGGATIRVDWGDGNLKDYDIVDYDAPGWVYSQVKGKLLDTSVKVYAPDAAKINYLDLSWTMDSDADAKIRSANLSKMTDVKEFGISKNPVSSLDLSAMLAMTSLFATDCELSSLTLPGEGNALKSVNVSNSYNVTTGLPNEGAGKNSVLATDWSALPNLITLNVTGNSYNNLGYFDSFDISKNAELSTLTVNCCDLPVLDVTSLSKLKSLNAQWNDLEDMDFSNIVVSKATVFLNNNNLKSVKLPEVGSSKMTRLNLSGNALTFATLPAPGITSNDNNYIYAPQATLTMAISKDNTVNLSEYAKVGETESTFAWKKGDEEIPASSYTVENGVFTFTENVEDVFCEIKNDVFPKLTMTTSAVTSIALLPTLMTVDVITPETEGVRAEFNSFGIGTAAENGQPVYIDWGDGNPQLYTLAQCADGNTPASIENKVLGDKITVYGATDDINSIVVNGGYIWATGLPGTSMATAVDVSNLKNLKVLNIKSNQITALNLGNNKALVKVIAESNKLTAFDAELPELNELNIANYGSGFDKKYGENNVTEVDFAKLPKLEEINVSYTAYPLDLTKANCVPTVRANACGLTSADFSDPGKLEYVFINNNKLTSVDAEAFTSEANLYMSDNEISEVKLSASLGNVNLSNNKLTFATLPAVGSVAGSISYSPQAAIAVEPAEGKIDLSSQAKAGDVETVFAWKAEDQDFSDYIANDGVFIFTKDAKDAVCYMTNEAFPDLTLTTLPVDITAADFSGVEHIGAEDGEPVYYNLQGVRTAGNVPGVYIRVKGNKATKVIVK